VCHSDRLFVQRSAQYLVPQLGRNALRAHAAMLGMAVGGPDLQSILDNNERLLAEQESLRHQNEALIGEVRMLKLQSQDFERRLSVLEGRGVALGGQHPQQASAGVPSSDEGCTRLGSETQDPLLGAEAQGPLDVQSFSPPAAAPPTGLPSPDGWTVN